MKKRFLALLLALAVSLSLSGCVSSIPKGEGGGDSAQKKEPITRTDTVGIPYSKGSALNPLTTDNRYNLDAAALIYDCLYDIAADFTAVPKLCEALTTDGISYSLRIKEGVFFHDGSSLTSADVVASLMRARAGGSPYSARLAHVTTVEAEGPYHVKVVLDRADYMFPANLSIPIVKKGSGEKRPLGSGRYAISGDSLVANEKWYFKTAAFTIKKVNLVDVADSDALVAAAADGRIDLLKLTSEDFSRISMPGGFSYKDIPTNELVYLGVNHSVLPLRTAEFRRGVSLSVDRNEILEDVLRKNGYVTQSLINPSHALFGASGALLSEKADTLFSSQGYNYDEDGKLKKGGRQVALNLLAPKDNSNLSAVADKVSSRLAKSGIYIEQQTENDEKYRALVAGGSFDLFLGQVKLTPDMDTGVLIGTGGALNFGRYASATLDSAIAAVRQAADEKSRLAAVSEFVSVSGSEMPVIPLYFNTSSLVMRTKLGLSITPLPYDFFNKLEVS